MSDGSGATPDPSALPEWLTIPPAEEVIPPPPPEIPVPAGLLAAPVLRAPLADAVIPPPPPEEALPATRSSRRANPLLDGDQPSAAADGWALPSVAPEVPTTGSYRGFAVAMFAFLFLLLVVAVVLLVYLVNFSTFSFASALAVPPLPLLLLI